MKEIEKSSLNQIEVEINFYKGQAVQSIFEIGERLNRAKGLVRHGEWGEWLENKVNFSQEQANRFMRVSREFSYSPTLTNLNQSKIFALLAVPSEERDSFIEENSVEDMTTRELRQAIKDKRELEQEVENLKSRPVETIEKEVIPADYQYYKDTTENLQDRVRDLNRNLRDKESYLQEITKEKILLERKAKLNEDDSKKYKQLKDQIENLTKEKNDIGRQIKAKTELSALVVRIEHILKTELAPIKYSRAIKEVGTDEIVTSNLRDIVDRVQDWCYEMNEYTGDNNIIRAEVLNYE